MFNTVLCNQFDKLSFSGIKQDSPKLSKIEQEGSGELATFADLMQDVYNSLYKTDPAMANNVPDTHTVNARLISDGMKTREYNELRLFTELDAINSAIATVSIAESLRNQIPEKLKELVNEKVELQKRIDQLKKAIELAGKNSDKDADKKSGIAQQKMKELEKAQQQMGANESAMQKELSENGGMFRQVMREAAQSASDKIDETNQIAGGWMGGQGELRHLDGAERAALAEKLRKNPKLAKIAKMAGRFHVIAEQKQRNKVTGGITEVVDVETGNDLSAVLPSELVYLTDPDLEDVFYKKYIDGELLQYKREDREPKGKGDIVAAVDVSGTMAGDFEAWAKAIALALLFIARKQKRSFGLIFFDQAIDGVWRFPQGKADPDKLMEIIGRFRGGGTEFEPPLCEYLEIAKESEFDKSDLVFITDGRADTSSGFIKEFKSVKAERKFNVISILLGHSAGDVARFSDRVESLYDILRDSDATDAALSL